MLVASMAFSAGGALGLEDAAPASDVWMLESALDVVLINLVCQ
jgi:hypothetical protein